MLRIEDSGKTLNGEAFRPEKLSAMLKASLQAAHSKLLVLVLKTQESRGGRNSCCVYLNEVRIAEQFKVRPDFFQWAAAVLEAARM